MGFGGIKLKDSKSNLISYKFSSIDYFSGAAISGKLCKIADIYAKGTFISINLH